MTQPFQSEISGRPAFSKRQVPTRLGARGIGSRLGTISVYLAVAARTSPCPRVVKDTLDTLHRNRYLRSIPRFNQKSKSHDFRLSSLGFVTRSSISLTRLVRTIYRVHGSAIPSVHVPSHLFARSVLRPVPRPLFFRPIFTVNGASANHSCPNVGLRRLF